MPSILNTTQEDNTYSEFLLGSIMTSLSARLLNFMLMVPLPCNSSWYFNSLQMTKADQAALHSSEMSSPPENREYPTVNLYGQFSSPVDAALFWKLRIWEGVCCPKQKALKTAVWWAGIQVQSICPPLSHANLICMFKPNVWHMSCLQYLDTFYKASCM